MLVRCGDDDEVGEDETKDDNGEDNFWGCLGLRLEDVRGEEGDEEEFRFGSGEEGVEDEEDSSFRGTKTISSKEPEDSGDEFIIESKTPDGFCARFFCLPIIYRQYVYPS